MTDMVERLARIISPLWFVVEDGVCGLDNYPDQHKRYQEQARQTAREVLAAMREADDAMYDAGARTVDGHAWLTRDSIVRRWQAMIDAALQKPSVDNSEK